jgi:TRAP-type C4-dicarboxylate transport system permease small subunit
VEKFVTTIEKTAGYLIGILAVITFGEAVLRYGLSRHIPDGFVIAKTMQGIAICWGIATATYADRHINVDVFYQPAPDWLKRVFDICAYTFNLVFLAAFGGAITYKVYDIGLAGERSTELLIPLWTGYTFAALGVLAAVLMAAIRWWQVVVLHHKAHTSGEEEAI